MSQQPNGGQLPSPWPAPEGQPWDVRAQPAQTRQVRQAPLWREILVAILVMTLAVGAAGAWVAGEAKPKNHMAPAAQRPLPSAQSPDPSPMRPATATHPVRVTPALSAGAVLVWGQLASSQNAGSGIVLTDTGLVLTNYHVVADTVSLSVQVPTTGDAYNASVVGRNVWDDIALLQLQGAQGLRPATIAQTPVQLGDDVTVVGNGDGGGVLVGSGGSVTSTGADVTLPSNFGTYGTDTLTGLIRSSAGAVPGYSGGPTFDAHAQVVGMTSAGRTQVSPDMTTFSIPIANALTVANDIVAGRQSGHTRIGPKPWLGASLGVADTPSVTRVQARSPASQAGITSHSTITAFNGQPVTTANSLLKLVDATTPGDRVTVTWIDQDHATQMASIRLGTSPTN